MRSEAAGEGGEVDENEFSHRIAPFPGFRRPFKCHVFRAGSQQDTGGRSQFLGARRDRGLGGIRR